MVTTHERRSAAYKPRHEANPYRSSQRAYSALVYAPDDYTLNKIVNLPARALRTLLIIAARYDATTGLCLCTKADMGQLISISRKNLSHATGELIEANLLAKAKKLDTYYLNPAAFRPIHHLL